MSTRTGNATHAAAALALLAGTVVIAVLLMQRISQPRIDASVSQLREQRLAEVLPPGEWDKALPGDTIHQLTDDAPTPIFRYWRDGVAAAAIMQVIAPDGYNGDIVLLIGVDAEGVVSGVRVLSHRETPGLGDDIELRRSDWITDFDTLSLEAMPRDDWALTSRGGAFDAFTGATITPRAVVRAVYRALVWFDEHSTTVFSLPRERP